MKVYSFFEKYVLVLLGILVFASCSDDDNAGVMSSKVMLNQELIASNYSFIWNGVTSPRKDDVKAKFEAVEGDSTKMKMTSLVSFLHLMMTFSWLWMFFQRLMKSSIRERSRIPITT